ncbi:MAG: histidine kinase [Desulfosalsimonadaceae bacterium]
MTFPFIQKRYLVTFAIVVLVVSLLTTINYGDDFITNMVIGFCLAVSMFSVVIVVMRTFRFRSLSVRMTVAALSLTAGDILGFVIGILASGKGLAEFLLPRVDAVIIVFVLVDMIGFLVWYVLYSQERISRDAAKIQEEKIHRLTVEKQMVETNLKLLQAQIEPHFLFNTLSIIIVLIETDPEKGRRMLEDLTSYLRISLCKTREEATTLGQEIDMVTAYLNIFKIRMGDRLNFSIQVPENLKTCPLPPMLLQPLVENSIIHGLEPKIEGGDIQVRAHRIDNRLIIEVADSGLRFDPEKNNGDHKGWGIGLSNIRERLDALYDGKAALFLQQNPPTGLKVSIEVPV